MKASSYTDNKTLWQLAIEYFKQEPEVFKQLSGDGSSRKNFLIKVKNKQVLGVIFSNVKTNRRFINYADYFINQKLAVPKILEVSKDYSAYLCVYLGQSTLAEYVKGLNDAKKFEIYAQILPWLDLFSQRGKNLVTGRYKHQKFGLKLYQKDWEYFIKYLINYMGYNHLLSPEFELIGKKLVLKLAEFKNIGFVHRDFQARNIIYEGEKIFFIDFQDGKFGPAYYDLASLLFASASGLDFKLKEQIWLEYFKKDFSSLVQEQFFHMALIRKLRSLGTYANLGLRQGKANFKGRMVDLFADLNFLHQTFPKDSKKYKVIFDGLEKVNSHLKRSGI